MRTDPRPTLLGPSAWADLGAQALHTYRWLRVGLLVALAGILAGIAVEWSRAPGHCFQGSISEYYWTPARPLFVGGLFAVAFGLVCVRGSSDAENVALNLAGLLTPIVAVVPMRPHTGCASVPIAVEQVAAAVDNNIRALLAVALAVLVGVAVSMVRQRVRRPAAWLGLGLGLVTVLGFGAWCALGIGTLVPAAHYVAAAGLFCCLGFVVARNARETPVQGLPWLYAALCVAMGLAVALCLATLAVPAIGWHLLPTELVLLGAFAIFWAVQTAELWHCGIRPGVR